MSKEDAAPGRDHYPHFSTISTRWTDNDVYSHVNNALYYNFFDTVIAGYLVAEGGFEFATTDVIGLAVESGCRYRRPLAFPQEIQMGLRVAHLGNSSVRYEIGIFAADNPPLHVSPAVLSAYKVFPGRRGVTWYPDPRHR